MYSTACSRKKKYTNSPISKEPTKLGSEKVKKIYNFKLFLWDIRQAEPKNIDG